MPQLNPRTRLAALGLKTVGLAVGIGALLLALGYAFDELSYLAGKGEAGMGDVVTMLAIIGLAFSGTALVAQLPESLRARFRRTPSVGRSRPVYGFGTMVAVGVGATLGSPLFILIPLNIEEYEVVSLASLVLATILSVAMAKVYADLGRESKSLGIDLVGGPSFARAASGVRSVRYFISRVSMWVGNTALAAYSEIVFVIFDFVYVPKILGAAGVSAEASTVIVYALAGGFAVWTLVNIFFEQRFLRALGAIQIVLTTALLVILVYHSIVLGGIGGWNLQGFLNLPAGLGWVPVLIINTGYLYLLFFGFQEIQVMERDSVERSSIPVISWVKRGFTLGKNAYFGIAMVVSVVVAAAANILYGLAVYASHPTLHGLQTAQIPALYLASSLGVGQGLLVAAAFLIATITTFVPAFLAASRHIRALGEDGYMPSSLASLSWVFTIVAVLLLAIGDQGFLVAITDVMVLISLGIIALSGIRLGRTRIGKTGPRALPMVVGVACFIFGGAIYFSPGGASVVVFGSLAIIFAYLIFDIIELGSLGAQLFLSAFGFVCVGALTVFNHAIHTSGVVLVATGFLGVSPNGVLVGGLLVASGLLGANVILDVGLLGRTSVR